MSKDRVDELLQRLTSTDQSDQAHAARELADLKDITAIPKLIVLLQSDSFRVRLRCVQILGKLGDSSAVPALAALLADDRSVVRNATAKALAHIGDQRAVSPLIAALNAEIDRALKGGKYAIANADTVARSLGAFPTWEVIDVLIGVMQNTATDAGRSGAAQALGRIGVEKVIHPLINALEDDYITLRAGAIEALGGISDSRAIDPLVEHLDINEHAAVRSQCIKALVKIGDQLAVPALQRHLEHAVEDWEIVATAKALIQLGDTEKREVLLAGLQSESKNMRCIASFMLGELRADYAVEALAILLNDDAQCGIGRKVFHSAAEALEKIGTSQALNELEKWQHHK